MNLELLQIKWLCFLFLFRGDIVIAKSPFDPNMNICKRVIGLEGDKVRTSGPSDLFKTHTYVSMFASYPSVFLDGVVLSSRCSYTSCDYLFYQVRLLVAALLFRFQQPQLRVSLEEKRQ